MKVSFILGAGASAEVGYPTGEHLRIKLIEGLTGNNPLRRDLLKVTNDQGAINQFVECLVGGQFDTIDELIGEFIESPNVLRIAKQAIFIVISHCESERTLFPPTPPLNAPWYKIFFEYLKRNPDKLRSDIFRFFTFNYDRSLEYFLYRTISNRNRFSPSFKADFFDNNFTHIHGSVGPLPWQNAWNDSYKRAYGDPLSEGHIIAGAKEILTPHERNVLSPEHTEELVNSDRIIFLGFGFDEKNLEKVHFSQVVSGNAMIAATSHGLKQDKKKTMQEQRVVFQDVQCREFIASLIHDLSS